MADLGIGDQFPAFVPYSALNLDIGQKHRVTNPGLLAFPDWTQTLAVEIAWRRDTNHVAQGREQIQQVGDAPLDLPCGIPGPAMTNGVRMLSRLGVLICGLP